MDRQRSNEAVLKAKQEQEPIRPADAIQGTMIGPHPEQVLATENVQDATKPQASAKETERPDVLEAHGTMGQWENHILRVNMKN